MDPGLTIACTLTAAAAAVYAGLICVKKCPPGKALVVTRKNQSSGKKDYKILTSGQTIVLPGIENAFLLDLKPFEVQISDPLPPSAAAGTELYINASLRVCIGSDINSITLAAAHLEDLSEDQIKKTVRQHLASVPLIAAALPADLSNLGDPVVGIDRLTTFWTDSLKHMGLHVIKYEFTGITKNDDALPYTPYGGEDTISQLSHFLDFQIRNEHFDIVVQNKTRSENQISLIWMLAARVKEDPDNLGRAANAFLSKDPDSAKTMISEELNRVIDRALLRSGAYSLFDELDRDAKKIGLGKAKTTKQFVLRALNALAEQSLSWRGKLSFIRFVLSALKVARELHDLFLKSIRTKFNEWGLELEEISLGGMEMKNTEPDSDSDGVITIAETEVCAYLEARWPIAVIESRTALVHANVCLKNEDNSNPILPPISDELKSTLTKSLEAALNSSKWRSVFSSIENLMEEIGAEELERSNLRSDRALEELIDRIGVTSFFLKLAKILLTGLEAYGEARRRFISISGDELRKRGLVIGTFAIVNLDLDRDGN